MAIVITTSGKKSDFNEEALLHFLNQLQQSGLTGLYCGSDNNDALVLYIENLLFEHKNMDTIDLSLTDAIDALGIKETKLKLIIKSITRGHMRWQDASLKSYNDLLTASLRNKLAKLDNADVKDYFSIELNRLNNLLKGQSRDPNSLKKPDINLKLKGQSRDPNSLKKPDINLKLDHKLHQCEAYSEQTKLLLGLTEEANEYLKHSTAAFDKPKPWRTNQLPPITQLSIAKVRDEKTHVDTMEGFKLMFAVQHKNRFAIRTPKTCMAEIEQIGDTLLELMKMPKSQYREDNYQYNIGSKMVGASIFFSIKIANQQSALQVMDFVQKSIYQLNLKDLYLLNAFEMRQAEPVQKVNQTDDVSAVSTEKALTLEEKRKRRIRISEKVRSDFCEDHPLCRLKQWKPHPNAANIHFVLFQPAHAKDADQFLQALQEKGLNAYRSETRTTGKPAVSVNLSKDLAM